MNVKHHELKAMFSYLILCIGIQNKSLQ